MKLIFLYGAPAVGKLTVAQELAKMSDISVFDNHQIIDLIEPLLTREYPGFVNFIYKTQRNITLEAVKANQKNIVTTFAYAANEEADVDFVMQFIMDIRTQGREVYPIFLHSSPETLRQRVTQPSRKAYGKVTKLEVINSMIDQYDFDTPVNIDGNFLIETDDLSASEIAQKIKNIADL